MPFVIEDRQSDIIFKKLDSDFIRDEAQAEALGKRLLNEYRNEKLKFKLKLPLSFISTEVGDLIAFTELLDSMRAYGIPYHVPQFYDDNQYLFPLFIVTSTNKNLDSVDIECVQIPKLDSTQPSDFA